MRVATSYAAGRQLPVVAPSSLAHPRKRIGMLQPELAASPTKQLPAELLSRRLGPAPR